MTPPRIGISRCLLGDEVRYDGGHKREPALLDAVGPHVEWVPVCPEVEIGMGTPREPIHLVARADGTPSAGARVRMVGVTSGRDWTEAVRTWASERVQALQALQLSGYILKANSPSCGPHVRVFHDAPGGGQYDDTRTARGLFAQALLDAMPNLPIADEEELSDPVAREAFLARVQEYRQIQQ